MPPFSIPLFRVNFPEFSDLVAYPTEQIQFWVTLAELSVSTCRWGNAWTYGVSLYVAHEISLAAQNSKIAQNGGMPGTVGGVATQKTIGGASVTYDANTTSEKDAGYWNLTNYGRKYIHLVTKVYGQGVIQL